MTTPQFRWRKFLSFTCMLGSLAAAACAADTGDVQKEGIQTLEGELEVHIANYDDGSSTTQYFLKTRVEQQFELFFVGDPELEPEPGLYVRITGELEATDLHSRIVVSELELAEEGDLGTQAQALANPTQRADYRVAVLMVHWGSPDSQTVAGMRQKVFTGNTSTDEYFRETSYGIQGLTGDVFGWYKIPDPGGCNYSAIASSARSAAAAAGVNISSYPQVMYYFPRTSACGWGGLAAIGTPSSPARDSWYNGSSGCVVLAQELAHNWGLMHSRSCSSLASGSTCSNFSEYGDPFCPMGSGCWQMNAVQRGEMAWYGGCNMVTANPNGDYVIAPIETPSNALQALRIPRGNGRYYYVENRMPIGKFDTWRSSSTLNTVFDGVLIHEGPEVQPMPSTNNRYPYLLDMNPGTSTFQDAALPVGRTYTSPEGIGITLLSKSDSGATVRVSRPGASGTATCMDGSTYGGGDNGGAESTVYLEAECATTATGNYTNVYTTESGYSGSGHIRSAANSTSSTFSTSSSPDRATYTVSNVKAGSYKLWFRVDTNGSGNDDSWFYRVDNGSWAFNNNHYSSTSWHWVQGAGGTITLSAGTHTIEIANREAGLNIDKIALLPASASAPSGSGGTANNCGPETGVYYSVKYRHSGKCLDVASSSTANGANVQQYSCLGSPNQKLKLEDRGGGYYALVFQHSGQCVDVASVSTADGANVLQWPCHYNDNQLFQLIDHANGYYSFKYKHSGKCVDVNAASVDNNANVIQWACHNNNNQQFEVVQ